MKHICIGDGKGYCIDCGDPVMNYSDDNKALAKKSTANDIEDAISDINGLINNASDLDNFVLKRIINKLEKAKRQILEML